MLPSLTIIQQHPRKERALILKGAGGEARGLKQATGSMRHIKREDAVGRPSSLTPGQFHSSGTKKNKQNFRIKALVFWCKRKLPWLQGQLLHSPVKTTGSTGTGLGFGL